MAMIRDRLDDPAVVYDLEADYGVGNYIDRREKPRQMKVDIDIRDTHKRPMWIYWGSDKSLVKAIKKTCKMVRDNPEWEVRIVETQDYTVIIQTTVKELIRLN